MPSYAPPMLHATPSCGSLSKPLVLVAVSWLGSCGIWVVRVRVHGCDRKGVRKGTRCMAFAVCIMLLVTWFLSQPTACTCSCLAYATSMHVWY